jgi:hypothetical protein
MTTELGEIKRWGFVGESRCSFEAYREGKYVLYADYIDVLAKHQAHNAEISLLLQELYALVKGEVGTLFEGNTENLAYRIECALERERLGK